MDVIKRNGRRETVKKSQKITGRIEKLCYSLDRNHVDPTLVAFKVIEGLYDGVTTSELEIGCGSFRNNDHSTP